jgi:Leucine-rich repeat (LRR) protein
MVLSLTLAAGGRATGAAETAGSPSDQLRQVMAKLKELNPAFDGKESHRFEHGALTELSFSSAGVTNLSPLRVLTDLRKLSCRGTLAQRTLGDLSPLRGMGLTELDIRDTGVSDLSPLEKTPLKDLRCDVWVVANKEAARLLVEKQMLERINGKPVAEFIQLANVAVAKRNAEQARESERAAAEFLVSVGTLPAEQQVAAVMAKLKEVNPGFDGRETHRVQHNAVVELAFSTAAVRNLWPVRALKWLRQLTIAPAAANEKGMVLDLLALQGMQLTALYCHNNPIRDLSPLKGMPLSALACGGTQVEDLRPLAGMKLTLLGCNDTAVGSLSPLEGMPLTVLWCNHTKVTDLSPLRGMPLRELRCDFVPERDAVLLRDIKTLAKINDIAAGVMWVRLDAAGGGKRR